MKFPVAPDIPAAKVILPNDGPAVELMSCGNDTVIPPDAFAILTWFVVPVSVANVYPVPFPTSNWPFDTGPVTPVPPRVTANVPVAIFPALRFVTALPFPESVAAVTPPTNVPLPAVNKPDVVNAFALTVPFALTDELTDTPFAFAKKICAPPLDTLNEVVKFPVTALIPLLKVTRWPST